MGILRGKVVSDKAILSPPSSVLSMEILSRLLRNLNSCDQFSYHPNCAQFKLTHLIFADDLMVFTRGDLPSIKAVRDVLAQFAHWSGLHANPDKTEIYFCGVPAHYKQIILSQTCFTEGCFPFRYLGLSLHTTRLNAEAYSGILGKIRGKIASWNQHSFSYAGKVQLINSILFGVENFWSGCCYCQKL